MFLRQTAKYEYWPSTNSLADYNACQPKDVFGCATRRMPQMENISGLPEKLH